MTEGAWEKAENTGEARAFALAPLKNKILFLMGRDKEMGRCAIKG
jgi:hypothetical protein